MTRRLFASVAALFAPMQRAELTPDKDLFKNGMCPVCFHQHKPPTGKHCSALRIPEDQSECFVAGERIRIDCDICSATFAVTVVKA